MVEIRFPPLTSFQIYLLAGWMVISFCLYSANALLWTPNLGLSHTKQKRWYGPVISSWGSNLVS